MLWAQREAQGDARQKHRKVKQKVDYNNNENNRNKKIVYQSPK